MDQDNKQIAAVVAATVAERLGGDSEAQANYTTAEINPNQAKENFEKFLEIFPPDVRQRYREFHEKELTKQLGKDNPDPRLDALLPGIKTIGAKDILGTVYPEIPWIVPNLLPPGLTILSGKPKIGKSWMALQLAFSVLTGGKFLEQDVKKGRVLYLALEDSERRLQGRMNKQGWPGTLAGVDFILFDSFHREIGSLNSGGGKRLMRFIETNQYHLVIVDTFSRSINGDQLDSSEMTEAIGPLQNKALKMDIALLILDHQPKNNKGDFDPITGVFGSVAKAGVLDTTWALYREQGKAGAKLAVTGREVASTTLQLKFNPEGFYWQSEGDAYELSMTQRRRQILQVLEDNGALTLTDLVNKINEVEEKDNHVDVSNTHKRLKDLVNEGLITQVGYGGKTLYQAIKRS